MKSVYKLLILTLFLCFCGNLSAQNTEERKIKFAWGAELESSIDLSSHNMSTIGITGELGIQWKWIRFFGVGIEGDIMVSNSSRTYPIFANFRTDFSNYNRLLFMDLRGGVALNYLYNTHNTEPYFSGGMGITLAKGKTFTSHIILAYTYLGNDICYEGIMARKCPGISLATMRLGILF